jgi:acyl phosphate:glycerol-3-phosphate acyltransferase
MKAFAVLFAAYILGSIPFSYLVTRIMTGKDIRQMGSKNVGATNVMRTTGRLPGLIALVLDVMKGTTSVLMARCFFPLSPSLPAAAGLMAMVGHSFPLFLRFKGGKSVATGAGAFFALSPYGILSSVGIFAIMLFSFRIVSVASMVGSATFPLFAWLYGSSKEVVILGALSACLILLRHKINLIRLFRGAERGMGDPKND